MTDILMSIKPPYVDMLISGCKTIEIRKRAVRAPAGARIWIYATSPRRQVVASARLEAVAVEAPAFRPQQSYAFLRDAALLAALEARCRTERPPTTTEQCSWEKLRRADFLNCANGWPR